MKTAPYLGFAMLLLSFQETRRLFSPLNRPDFNTNVRHRAILRKALELFPPEDLQAIFDRPIKLRVAWDQSLPSASWVK
jgi:hypothetical protein